MSRAKSAQTAHEALGQQYEKYIDALRLRWLAENRMRSNNVYEVMCTEEREEVRRRIAQWREYITPLAEAWWRERGYAVIWPDDNSKPMQVYKLGAASQAACKGAE